MNRSGSPHQPTGLTGDPDQPCTDDALVAGIASGDRTALAEIYERHSSAVYGLAHKICEPDKTNKIVRHVFMQVWRQPESFGGTGRSLRADLLASAHRLAIEGCRRDPALQDRQAKVGNRPDVGAMLVRLPAPEREAISLTYFGGYTYGEAAVALGEPEATIKQRLRSGLASLRQQLIEDHIPSGSQ
ncbi:MAG: RNA polymerase sigma factor [Acidimicrobiales bacterium]